MKWSAICVADIHMSNRLPYSKPTSDGKTDRLEDQLKMWDQIHSAAEHYDVDDVLILGDLFDRANVEPVTLTHTVEAIMKTKRNICILPGNHDAGSVKGGRFVVEAFREMKNDLIQVIGEKPGDSLEIEMDGKNLVLWPLAYSPVSKTEEELKLVRKNMSTDDVNILLIHNSIMGAHHLGWECDDGLDPRKTCANFDLVLAGHFHENQALDAEVPALPEHYQYLGAPMHHSFSDVGRESLIWLYEFEDKPKGKLKISITKIPIKAPEFFKMEFGDDYPDMKSGDFLRVEVKATSAEWAKKRRVVEAQTARLVKKGIRVQSMHKPIYHHKARTKKSKKGPGASFSLEAAIKEYVGAVDVSTVGLSKKRLKKLGLEALTAVRSEHGTT